MARALPCSQLTANPKTACTFALATEPDDPEIRRLLRENPTPGQISLSLQREPDYFSDALVPGHARRTLIARENGRVTCIGSCTVRQRFVNGRPRSVGYLGELRLDNAFAGRFDILRRGYDFFRELESASPADFYFTSIAAHNVKARRFLERGLPGMPAYEFLGEFVTVVLRTMRSGTRKVPLCSCAGHEIISRLNAFNRQYQFSPAWSVPELRALQLLGLGESVLMGSPEQPSASAALWDQRGFKQTLLRGYGPSLATLRPVLNLAARLLGQPNLPPPNTILANALLTLLLVSPEAPAPFLQLLAALRNRAFEQGLELLTLGFAGNDPRLAIVRSHFRRREYLTRLYLVRWPEFGGSVSALDTRILAPELALL